MLDLKGTSFEVIFYSTWYDAEAEAVHKIIATGAPTPVLHAEKSIGPAFASDSDADIAVALARFDANCRLGRAIGAHRVVLHLWGLPDSDLKLPSNLAGLPRLLDIAAEYGLTLSIETLLCAISTPLDVVARCREVDPRAKITLDTVFLAMHDQLQAAVDDDRLWSAGVDHVHLKDYRDPRQGWGAGRYLHPDDGILDLAGFLRGVDARGYAGTVTLEAPALLEDDTPDVSRIEASLDWIRRVRSV